MAIVTVSVSDAAPVVRRWELPGNYDGLRSPIPIGTLLFRGFDAIATKGAGDETAYTLTLTMPGGAAYLPRSALIRFSSDDLTSNFSDLGFGFYLDDTTPANLINAFLLSAGGGLAADSAVVAEQIWSPAQGASKLILPPGGTLRFRVNDLAAGASTAGDMAYWVEFYIFNVDQVDKWEVNTPIPTISHTSF